MKTVHSVIAGIALATAASTSSAALINFTGTIDYHNDVVHTYFTLDQDATNVRVWTDSYKDGQNFDPITALWKADGTRLQQNDDNDSINPDTQTSWDSGFSLANLAAGDYIFTVATYDNFALGNNLSDGFEFDGEAAIALADWDQPASRKGMGPNWSVWLDGVDSASNPSDPGVAVPEPSSFALIGLGMIGLGLARRRKQANA